MPSYWIGDAVGRVLGPLTLAALRELVGSGKLRAVTRASRDGDQWVPIHDFPEVKDLLTAAPASSAAFEQGEAERLRGELRQLQSKPVYEVFGVNAHASLDELRSAFFRRVKRYAPERLGPEVHAELKKASAEMFDFLSRRMREAEAQHVPPPAPSYGSQEFVGLQRRSDDRLHADIQVNPRTVGMFTDHALVNLSSGSIFIPSERPLRLGTEVEMTLHFENPPKQIEVRGSVIWEHAFNDGKQPQGYGVRLSSLNPTERSFLADYVRKVRGA